MVDFLYSSLFLTGFVPEAIRGFAIAGQTGTLTDSAARRFLFRLSTLRALLPPSPWAILIETWRHGELPCIPSMLGMVP